MGIMIVRYNNQGFMGKRWQLTINIEGSYYLLPLNSQCGRTTWFSGKYLFIETSAPRVQGDVARISSQQFPATTGLCVTFWFHMYGTSVGTLNVYMVTGSTNRTLWSVSGDHKDNWLSGQAGIVSNTPFTVWDCSLSLLRLLILRNCSSLRWPTCCFNYLLFA